MGAVCRVLPLWSTTLPSLGEVGTAASGATSASPTLPFVATAPHKAVACTLQCPTVGFNHTTWMRLVRAPEDPEGFRARFATAAEAAWRPFEVVVADVKVRRGVSCGTLACGLAYPAFTVLPYALALCSLCERSSRTCTSSSPRNSLPLCLPFASSV